MFAGCPGAFFAAGQRGAAWVPPCRPNLRRGGSDACGGTAGGAAFRKVGHGLTKK